MRRSAHHKRRCSCAQILTRNFSSQGTYEEILEVGDSGGLTDISTAEIAATEVPEFPMPPLVVATLAFLTMIALVGARWREKP